MKPFNFENIRAWMSIVFTTTGVLIPLILVISPLVWPNRANLDDAKWADAMKWAGGATSLAVVAIGGVGLAKSTQSKSNAKNQDSASDVNDLAQEILNAHNSYRSEVGVPSLSWADTLANHAGDWANQLASSGTFEHSHTEGEGENLWMGSSGAFSFTDMVNGWGSEQQYFQGGIFPDVSSTGNWADVGHYTQMVWRETSQVGCAIADGGDGNTYLVCRYTSPGNFEGQPVY